MQEDKSLLVPHSISLEGRTNQSNQLTFQEIPNQSRELPTVILGRVDSKWIDEATASFSDLGFEFTVYQASHGPTGITAKPLEEFQIETPEIDKETKAPIWVPPSIFGTVSVASNEGNMSLIPADSPKFSQEFMGNEGVRSGIIRVTNQKTGEVKYYALGAKFSGRPDSWTVKRGLIEVELQQELPAPKPELPKPTP